MIQQSHFWIHTPKKLKAGEHTFPLHQRLKTVFPQLELKHPPKMSCRSRETDWCRADEVNRPDHSRAEQS